jgi:hypothetical protein
MDRPLMGRVRRAGSQRHEAPPRAAGEVRQGSLNIRELLPELRGAPCPCAFIVAPGEDLEGAIERARDYGGTEDLIREQLPDRRVSGWHVSHPSIGADVFPAIDVSVSPICSISVVMIGVRADGTKELIAVEDGCRESTDSWATVLRDLKRRGLRAPVVAVGDSAWGFWAAVGAVWPETREQRCWVHRLANVLDKLPKRLQPKANQALHAIMNAPTRAEPRPRYRRLRRGV